MGSVIRAHLPGPAGATHLHYPLAPGSMAICGETDGGGGGGRSGGFGAVVVVVLLM